MEGQERKTIGILVEGGAALRIQKMFRGRQQRKLLTEMGIDVQKLMVRDVAIIRSIYQKTRRVLQKDGGVRNLQGKSSGRLKKVAEAVLEGSQQARFERFLIEAVNERMIHSNLRELIMNEVRDAEDDTSLMLGLKNMVQVVGAGLEKAQQSGIKLSELSMIMGHLNSQLSRIQKVRCDYDDLITKLSAHNDQGAGLINSRRRTHRDDAKDAAMKMREEEIRDAQRQLDMYHSAFTELKDMLAGIMTEGHEEDEDPEIPELVSKLDNFDPGSTLKEELDETVSHIIDLGHDHSPDETDSNIIDLGQEIKDQSPELSEHDGKEAEVEDELDKKQEPSEGRERRKSIGKELDAILEGAKATSQHARPSINVLAEIADVCHNLADVHQHSHGLQSSLGQGTAARHWTFHLSSGKLGKLLQSAQPCRRFAKNIEQADQMEDLPVIFLDDADAAQGNVEPGWHELRSIEDVHPSSLAGTIQATFTHVQALVEQCSRFKEEQLVGIELGSALKELPKKPMIPPPASPSSPQGPPTPVVVHSQHVQWTAGEVLAFLEESLHTHSSAQPLAHQHNDTHSPAQSFAHQHKDIQNQDATSEEPPQLELAGPCSSVHSRSNSSNSSRGSPNGEAKESLVAATTTPKVSVKRNSVFLSRLNLSSPGLDAMQNAPQTFAMKNFKGLELDSDPQSNEDLQRVLELVSKKNKDSLIEFDLQTIVHAESQASDKMHRAAPVMAWETTEQAENPTQSTKPVEAQDPTQSPQITQLVQSLQPLQEKPRAYSPSLLQISRRDQVQQELPRKGSVMMPKAWEFRNSHAATHVSPKLNSATAGELPSVSAQSEVSLMSARPDAPAVSLPPVQAIYGMVSTDTPRKTKMKTREHVMTHPCRALIENALNPRWEENEDDEHVNAPAKIELASLSPHFKKQLRKLRRPSNLLHLSPRPPAHLKAPTTKARAPRLQTSQSARSREVPLGSPSQLPPVCKVPPGDGVELEEGRPVSRFYVVSTPNNPLARKLQRKTPPSTPNNVLMSMSFNDSHTLNLSSTAGSRSLTCEASDAVSSVVHTGCHAVRRANGRKEHVDIHLWGWSQ